MLPYHTESASSSLPVRSDAAGGTRGQEILAQLEHVGRNVRPPVPPRRPRLGPAHRLDRDQASLDLDDPAEDETRVHREPHRLLQRGGGEIKIEETVGLAAVPVDVPVAGIVEIETAELEPCPAVVRRRREVAAEQVDRHVALALAFQRGRAGSDVGIDGTLRRRHGHGQEREKTRRECAAQPGHRCRSDEAGLPGARVHSRLKMVCPSALG